MALLVVLVLDVHVKRLDVFGFRVRAVLVQSQVVVGQLALVSSNVLDQRLVLAFKCEVGLVVAVDLLDLLFHFDDFAADLLVFALEEVVVVVAVVDLAAGALGFSLHARDAA